MTVMDRLVAELGGIETAIVALQEQVQLESVKIINVVLIVFRLRRVLIAAGFQVKMNKIGLILQFIFNVRHVCA